MSRILVESMYQDHPVELVMGWDRRLNTCFLQINLIDEQLELPEMEALADLSMEVAMANLSFADVENALARSGLQYPAGALEELRQDMAVNAGNKIVSFLFDGARKQLT